MSLNLLHEALENLARELNAGAQVADPATIIQNHSEFVELAHDADLERHFTRFSDSVMVPKAVEAFRLLINLKQRWNETHDGKLLIRVPVATSIYGTSSWAQSETGLKPLRLSSCRVSMGQCLMCM